MSTLILALMMQYVVSAKAGLINYAQGLTNVRPNQIVAEMTPIRTGPNGVVELLLTPGSYLRLGPQSEAIIDNSDIANVHVRITGGQAIVEIVEINDAFPIFVSSGRTQVELGDPGIYRFNDGAVAIVEGKLKTVGDLKTTYKKGWEVAFTTNYRAKKLTESQMTSLDLFSQKRSELLANASASLIPTIQRTSYSSYNPFWLYSPFMDSMVYIPLRNIRSPYGFRYIGFGVPMYGNRNNMNTANNNNPSTPNPPSGSSNSNSGSSGGNFNSAGERTFSTPGGGERQTVGEYQERKNPSVPAGPPVP